MSQTHLLQLSQETSTHRMDQLHFLLLQETTQCQQLHRGVQQQSTVARQTVPVLVAFVLDTLETVTVPKVVPKIDVSPELRAVTRESRAAAAAVLSEPVNAIVSSTLTDEATTESMVTLASTSRSLRMFASNASTNCTTRQVKEKSKYCGSGRQAQQPAAGSARYYLLLSSQCC